MPLDIQQAMCINRPICRASGLRLDHSVAFALGDVAKSQAANA